MTHQSEFVQVIVLSTLLDDILQGGMRLSFSLTRNQGTNSAKLRERILFFTYFLSFILEVLIFILGVNIDHQQEEHSDTGRMLPTSILGLVTSKLLFDFSYLYSAEITEISLLDAKLIKSLLSQTKSQKSFS
jgi:hypothetical protein